MGKSGLKPKAKWPDIRKPVDQWSPEELRGLTLCACITGIGSHPRKLADEDWIIAVEKDAQQVGEAQFLTDLLYITRQTIPHYMGPQPPLGNYPKKQTTEQVPLPRGAHPNDRNWTENWNAEMVEGVLCNPKHAGIPGVFEQVVDDRTWIRAGLKAIKKMGLRQYLANFLHQLKSSIVRWGESQ
jgi:hypothetical protein